MYSVYEGVVSYSWLLEIKSMTHFLASLSNILVLYACALFSKIEHYFMLIISGLSNKQKQTKLKGIRGLIADILN